MTDVGKQKKLLRNKIREAVACLENEQKCQESEAVRLTIEGTVEFEKAQVIMCYCSMPSELNTAKMLQCWPAEKTIVLPRVNGLEMEVRLFDKSKMKSGQLDILEPTTDCQLFSPEDIDLIIVPGMAFDVNGNRLGHGKGFYDRFIVHTEATLFGVCFNCQLVDQVPTEGHDKKMHRIITASKIINCDKINE